MTDTIALPRPALAPLPATAFAPARGEPPQRPGTAVRIDGLRKAFGERTVLRDFSLDVEPGTFLAIVGRSGCGKSTLLRALAGLEATQAGSIAFDGQPHATGIAQARLMYQEPRLLPWKRVIDNVAIGLESASGHQQALRVLGQVGLADRANDWPSTLSGGQRQRVALARALVHRPRLLLLDEPLGALDALTRIEMQSLIESLWQEHAFTAILVTHDVSEAIALADRVVLIEEGELAYEADVGLPRPRPRATADFARIEETVLQRVLQRA